MDPPARRPRLGNPDRSKAPSPLRPLRPLWFGFGWSWRLPLGTWHSALGFYNAAMRIARGHTIGIVLIAALILIYLVVRYFHVAPWGAR